jgi:tRNA (guanosine-2'-O-)-methyltransferase
MLSVLRRRQPALTVVMENIHDPHNVSAILRTADAVGVTEIQLVYTDEEFPKLGKKSSASAVKWIDRRKFTSMRECCDQLHGEGWTIYATRLAGDAKLLYDVDLTRKTALIFGNEHRGVSDEAAKYADVLLRIPMTGMIQSLNVSVACAVCLYEALRQRSKAGMYEKPALSPAEIEDRFRQWTQK